MPEFDSAGVAIHYELAGPEDGQPVVFVNGYCSNYEVNWIGSRWIDTFTRAGRRSIGMEPRGHGRSGKPHDPKAYGAQMAEDVPRLLDHLGLGHAEYVGYSMGSQIGLRLLLDHPDRLRRAVLGGLGIHGLRGVGPTRDAVVRRMRGDESIDDPLALMFYTFARSIPINDLEALACVAEGSYVPIDPAELSRIRTPVLVAVGGADQLARGARELAAQIPGAEYFEVEGRDHTTAVPSRAMKERALEFLA